MKKRGQALVLILLVMAAVLTLGLAASQQVVTDLKISRQQEEAAKAYSAAEAGVERALIGEGVGEKLNLGGGVVATVTKTDIGGGKTVIWPDEVGKGQGTVFWLVNHQDNGSLGNNYYQGKLDVYWQTDARGTKPALILALFYQKGAAVKYWALDPDAVRRGSNNFERANGGNFSLTDTQQGQTLTFRARTATAINLASYSQPIFLWVRVLYGNSRLGFQGDKNLPVQGAIYLSQGEVGPTGATEVASRRIQAFRTYAQPPLLLLEPVVSFGGINVGR